MQVRHIGLGAALDAERGSTVVCIPVPSASGHLATCVRTVLEHTPDVVPIIVCDGGDGDADGRSVESTLAELEPDAGPPRELLYVRPGAGAGLAAAVNTALAIAAPADAVLLAADSAVAAEWLERLRQAAHANSTVATASALCCALASWSDGAAAAVRGRSLCSRPRLESAAGPCVYVRRAALELAGELDAAALTGRGEDGDFSRRCVRSGLLHVLADDVLVLDRQLDESNEGSMRSAARTDGTGPLTRPLSRFRRALGGLSVVVDARILSGPTTGTHVHVLELIAALARTEQLRLSAVVPDHLNADAARSLESASAVMLLTHGEARRPASRRADLVHRPFQVGNPGDLTFLLSIADRLVVTQQDLIQYHNSSYFPSADAWEGYRRLSRTTLAVADRVLFFSAHAREDALADDLVDPTRADAVPIGVDHEITGLDRRPQRPAGAARLPEQAEVILCLGTDYHHKNRLFALRVLEELERRHGWRGRLVLAGAHMAHGSSVPDEERLIAATPALAEAVLDLGPVNEAEKAWLLEHARLVLYPTVREGFGLVPFEAAHSGVPCMWAAGTSLSEVLPDDAAAIVAWDAAQSADRALELMRDERTRARNLALIRTAAERLTWDAAAARLLEVYEKACDAPPPPAAVLERRYGLLTGGLSEDAMRLMGPGGALPADVERPLLALATHPRLGTPVFRALQLGYRTSYTLRRWGRRKGIGEGSQDRQRLR